VGGQPGLFQSSANAEPLKTSKVAVTGAGRYRWGIWLQFSAAMPPSSVSFHAAQC
jgi:hypothetical protein